LAGILYLLHWLESSLVDGLVMLRAGFTTPEDKKRLRMTYLAFGTVLAALVAGAIAWYISVNLG
jgi:hypothetical protein